MLLRGLPMNNHTCTLNYFLFIILGMCLLCPAGCKSTEEMKTTTTLYFEPPRRLIEDYAGMFQTDQVNWAWSQIGFKFSNYQSLSLKPVHLIIDNKKGQGLASAFDQGFLDWFNETGVTLSERGTIFCEGAIVEAKLEKGFFEKINLFDEDKRDFMMEVEVVIKETGTNTTVCKIRHGAIAAEIPMLQERILAGITSYFSVYE